MQWLHMRTAYFGLDIPESRLVVGSSSFLWTCMDLLLPTVVCADRRCAAANFCCTVLCLDL